MKKKENKVAVVLTNMFSKACLASQQLRKPGMKRLRRGDQHNFKKKNNNPLHQ